jgi:ABC-type transporter Mla MlaB component
MARSEAQTIAFALSAPIARADLQQLCECVCGLLERTGAGVALCDVSRLDPSAVTVEGLARLQLAARRCGCEVRLRRPSNELQKLVDFMGLADVLPQIPD